MCCITHPQFFIDGKWHTWIDYSKFHELVLKKTQSCIYQSNVCVCVCVCVFPPQIQRYEATEGRESFTALDYVSPTPDWAVLGHDQRGFDPRETRWFRKNKKKDIGGC